MPLAFSEYRGEANIIKKIGGTPEVKKHLGKLGIRGRRRRHGSEFARRQSDCERKGIARGYSAGRWRRKSWYKLIFK